MNKTLAVSCRLCESDQVFLQADISRRPERENDFKIPEEKYKRAIYRCGVCDVFFNHHDFIPENFYQGAYNAAVYDSKLKDKYHQIMALPFEKSDNRQRVQRVHERLQSLGFLPTETKVLDIGSGLCVFLGALKELNYACYALDPDPAVIRHAENNVGIDKGFVSNMSDFETDIKFDVITFNKVLEHVQDPIKLLQKAIQKLTSRGIIYIELPDGETAFKKEGIENREEFFIEHFTVFSLKSLSYLTEKSGLISFAQESIHEPSDKYTIYGFHRRANHG